MKLVVVRHAKAEEKSDFARISSDDGLRPLTPDGRERMRGVARGLHRIVPKIDCLISSPLVRARQTAEIIAQEYQIKNIGNAEELSPGCPKEQIQNWLKAYQKFEVVAVVGHEPDLGEMISWFLSGNAHSFAPLKKGGVCVLDFPANVKAKQAQLLWLMEPNQLKNQ